MPQAIGIILVLIATGQLEDPLPDERLQRVLDRSRPVVGHGRSQGSAEPKGSIGFREPDEAAITGELRTVEAGLQGEREGRETADGGCGRLGHKASPVEGWG
jgi:hypothetical protein